MERAWGLVAAEIPKLQYPEVKWQTSGNTIDPSQSPDTTAQAVPSSRLQDGHGKHTMVHYFGSWVPSPGEHCVDEKTEGELPN
jgi:hypothetical protein